MNKKTRNALELARDALLDLNSAYSISAIDAIDAALSAPDLNLSDRAVQKRLAAQWGYVPAHADPVAQEPVRELASALLDEIDGLIEESSGVYGLHRNGDQSPWGELAEGGRFERLTSMEALRSALAAPPAPATPVARAAPVVAWMDDGQTGGYGQPERRVVTDEAKKSMPGVVARAFTVPLGVIGEAPATPVAQPLDDITTLQAELWKLAVRKGLVTVHTEQVATPDPVTKVSWLEGHAKACDVSNDAARRVGQGGA